MGGGGEWEEVGGGGEWEEVGGGGEWREVSGEWGVGGGGAEWREVGGVGEWREVGGGGEWGWGLRRQERQCDVQEVILVQCSQMQTQNKSSQPMY